MSTPSADQPADDAAAAGSSAELVDSLPVERDRLQVQVRIAPRTVFMVATIVLLFWGGVRIFYALDTVLFWLVTAMFLAMASDPAVQAFQRRGMSRGWAITTFFFALVTLLTIIGAVFVPIVIEQTEELVRAVPGYIGDLQRSDWFQSADERFGVLDQAAAYLESLPGTVSTGVGGVVNGVVNGVFGVVTILLLTIFLLIDGERLVQGVIQTAPQVGRKHWWRLSVALYTNVGRYVAGRLLVSFTAALALLIVAAAIGMPSAVPLALWMFLLGLIPMVGATLGSLPAILVAFFYSDPVFGSNLIAGIFLVAYIVVYQQIENAVIEPRIVGKTVSLAPFIVFVSILIGGTLLGVIGALMAIPVAGVLQVALRDIADAREAEGKAPAEAAGAAAAMSGQAPEDDER